MPVNISHAVECLTLSRSYKKPRDLGHGRKMDQTETPDLDLDKFQSQYEQEAEAWRPQFMKFMQDTLSSACERPYLESSAFFEAFGKAVVMKPDELLTERTMGVGDKICWSMFVMWQEIEGLHSVAELHRILELALKPKGIIVKYKRVEKLCQRIKFKIQSAGSSSRKEIQTNCQVGLGVCLVLGLGP